MTSFERGDARVPLPPPVPPGGAGNGHDPQPSSDGRAVPPAPTLLRQASAPRRWTAKGLALAVILVVSGGLVVMIGVQALTERTAVLVVARAVPMGSTVDASDLTTAKITSDPALTPVPASDRGVVLGKVALVDLRPGTLLTREEVGTSDGFTSGQVLVPLPLKQGQFPARGLAPGQSVLVVATPGANANGAPGSVPAGLSAAGTRAVVAEVGGTDVNSGVTVVDVRVAAGAAAGLAQLASTGNAAVLLLPAGR